MLLKLTIYFYIINKLNKEIMKKFFHSLLPYLKQLPPVLFKVSIGGFILVSVALYFQSCVSSMDAEKFHYNGSLGKCVNHRTVVVDTIR